MTLPKLEAKVEGEIIHLESWKLPIPWEISLIQPQFQFYVSNQVEPIKIDYSETTTPDGVLRELTSAGFLVPKTISRIIFITHGFENDIDTPWLPQMKDEILKVDPKALVALLGWGGGSNIHVYKYSQAAANTQSVAKWFQDYLIAIRNSVPNEVIIWGIAHSLGAHLLGLAGRQSGQAFDRITGLDPAGPSFEKVNQENRLRKTDAKVVDVIHTDGYDSVFDPADWFAPVNHYGTLIPLGTTDFYPNFGYRQPGISHFRIAESHHRSIELFLWSIGNPGKFLTNAVLDGVPSYESPVDKVKYDADKVEMGFHFSDTKTAGLFYVETNSAVPWSEGPAEDCVGWGWPFSKSSCIIS